MKYKQIRPEMEKNIYYLETSKKIPENLRNYLENIQKTSEIHSENSEIFAQASFYFSEISMIGCRLAPTLLVKDIS
jgi:hypothetical protein